MRSELVFGAMAHVPNRFLLTKLASKAVRKLHRPNTRIQNTANDVFARFSRANPIAVVQFKRHLNLFRCAAQAEDHSCRAHPKQSAAWSVLNLCHVESGRQAKSLTAIACLRTQTFCKFGSVAAIKSGVRSSETAWICDAKTAQNE